MSKKSFLDSIESPSPCSADWDKMIGDERVRFCQSCEKNVYNISAMPRAKARKLVAKNAGKICIRYVRLPDGKVLTSDTKLYKIAGRASRLAAGVFGATLTLSAIAGAQTETTATTPKAEAQKIETKKDRDYSKTSRITFIIDDANGAIIPNAEVKLTNQKTKEEFTAYADEKGAAQFNFLPQGLYEVAVSCEPFKNTQRTIQIKQPVEPNIKINLEIGGMTGVVVVDWSEIPLFQAIAQEDNETVMQLINSGFDINTKDKGGNTALHVAVEHANLEIIKFLLDKGAKVNIKNKSKYTPILMIDEEETGREILRLLIAKGADVNVYDDEKRTLLMGASEEDDLEIVKLLLEAGANPNLKDEDGETALDKTDSEEIKQLLIRYGAKKSDN